MTTFSLLLNLTLFVTRGKIERLLVTRGSTSPFGGVSRKNCRARQVANKLLTSNQQRDGAANESRGVTRPTWRPSSPPPHHQLLSIFFLSPFPLPLFFPSFRPYSLLCLPQFPSRPFSFSRSSGSVKELCLELVQDN